jgi:hypothetical protein
MNVTIPILCDFEQNYPDGDSKIRIKEFKEDDEK